MTLTFIFILFLLVIGTLPTWPYSKKWGSEPSLAFTVISIIALFFLITGQPIPIHASI
jgi:Protein of unknown function (DUF3309).